jgi:hypothetical protein
MKTKIVATRFTIVSAVLLCSVAFTAHATNITVTNTNDSGPGSLRQALADANDGDTINFAVTGTIGLTSGELAVDKSITISGPGPTLLAVSAGGLRFAVFHVMPGHTVTIEGLMISDSNAGGIHNDHATLTVSNCVVFHNQGGNGGGIYNDAFYQESATLTIVNSIVDTNCACYAGGGFGGGIYSDGTLTIVSTTVSNNFALTPPPEALGSGGGIYNSGPLTITGSTITRNFAGRWGGGIAGGGTITDSTVSGNTAGGPLTPKTDPASAAVSSAEGPLAIALSAATQRGAAISRGLAWAVVSISSGRLR